ncbi:MAG: hypothetical protein LBI03_06260 [Clostridiales bacterium]|jgi:hypothetical protein|nr:hypothetical protein [Clostridiales bacterium]
MLNKEILKSIENDIKSVIEKVGAKYGLEIRFDGGSYSDVEATIRLKIIDNIKNSDEYLKKEWDKCCTWYGFKPEHFGTTVIDKGEEIRLIGFNNGKPKNCIRFIKTKEGEEYMCSQEYGHKIFKIPDEGKKG